MKKYKINYNKTINIVLALILPSLTIIPVLVLLAMYMSHLPDWGVGSIIAFFMVGIGLYTFYIIKKISPKGILTLRDDGFVVEFSETGFFVPGPFEIKIKDITNFFAEGNNAGYYMSFTTDIYPAKFNIGSVSKKEEDLASFTELMGAIAVMIDSYNKSKSEYSAPDEPVITNVTMYERGWAKVLVAFSIIVFVGLLIMCIVMPSADSLGWVRLVAIVSLGVPFAVKVFYYNKRKKKS